MNYNELESQFGLPPGILKAVRSVESSGGKYLVSDAGALGDFGFMPKTAKAYGIDPLDPVQAANGAARMLSDLGRQYGGNWDAALAHYNGGTRAGKAVVSGGVAPSPETRAYIPKVRAAMGNSEMTEDDAARLLGLGGKPGPVGRPAGMSEEAAAKLLGLDKSAAYLAGQKAYKPVDGAGIGVLNGATFGFGDEISGAIAAPIDALRNGKSLGQAYRDNRDFVRGKVDRAKEEDTWLSTGANIVGGAASGGLVKSAAERGLAAVAPSLAARYAAWINPAGQTAGMVPRTTQAVASGAGYGAISGAGDSTADNAADLFSDMGKGALVGGASSGGLYAAGAGMAAVGGNVASRVSDRVAQNHAQQKVAEAIARDARGELFATGAANPGTKAVARYGKLGPEATVSDAAGQSTRSLLDTVATLPGRTKDRLEQAILERQAGRAGRLVTAADNALGTRGAGYAQTLEALDATRKQAAAPFYQALENHVVTVDDDVARLIAKTQGTHAEAQRLYQLQTGSAIKLGELQPGDPVPFSMLDTLKQSLHDAAETQKRQGGNKMARALDDVRVSLTNKLDTLAPVDRATGQSVYKLARDAYSGPSQLIDAAEIGRTAMKADVFDVSQAVKGMSDSERSAFRVGALQALREKTGTQAGQTSLLKMWMEPATRDRLKEVFGSDYRQFAAEVAREARLKGMEGLGRGSQTASRMFGAGDLDVSPLSDIGKATGAAKAGDVAQAIGAVKSAWNRVQTPESVRNQMGQILLSRGGQGAASLRQMENLIDQINRQSASRAAMSGVLSTSAINGSGSIIGRGLLD